MAKQLTEAQRRAFWFVRRSGGVDRYSHLKTHGIQKSTIRSLVRKRFLSEPEACLYILKDEGRAALEAHDE